MGSWVLRMTWGLEACFTVFHSEPASALSLLTVWSLWGNPGMARCWRKNNLICWIHPEAQSSKASSSGICWWVSTVHHQIPLLLAKSALSCWMYPTAQIALSPTPSHPWVPPEWPYCQQAQCGRWFTVKHSKAGLQPATDPSWLPISIFYVKNWRNLSDFFLLKKIKKGDQLLLLTYFDNFDF